MIKNKLSKWQSVAFRNLENRTFAAKCLSINNNTQGTLTATPTTLRLLSTSSKLGSGSKLSIGFNQKLSFNYSRLYSSSSKLPPHEIILMPALSPTMTTGNIGTFQKKVGDSLEAGDVLCEIETDKAQMDFEVQEEGFLAKILISEGTKDAEVGKPLAIVVTKKEDIGAFENYTGDAQDTNTSESKADPVKAAESESPEMTSKTDIKSESQTVASSPSNSVDSSSSDSDRIKASPLAKKLAKEQNINLHGLQGSGPNGRIIKNDLPNATKIQSKPISSATTGTFVDIPVSGMRKVIASRLTESKQSIPHYYLSTTIQMDKILSLRSKFNSTPLLQETFGSFKLSVNDFIVKAAGLALKQVPECNSAWYGDFIRQYETVDICVAVATPSGLITPIISSSDQQGLVAISTKIKELASRAKINKLKPEEYQGGTFTISNLGMFGVESFTAIINPPQSCILAVGTTKPQLISNPEDPNSNQITGNFMTVTLSCDHRVVDGATGARWLNHFKRFLEDPEQMIL